MNDEKINVKTILVIFILHNEEKLILKKPRLSLIKLNDDISSFILEYIDDIEELAFKKPSSEPRTSEYWRHMAEEAEKRMDIIGQNGNDGLHYSENENQMELEL